MLYRSLLVLILSLSCSYALSQPVDVKKLEVVEMTLKFRITGDQCWSGDSFLGTVAVTCEFKNANWPSTGRIVKQGFEGDEYFEVEVSNYGKTISFLFKDDYGNDPATFFDEVKDYYQKNEVYYYVVYQGPAFDPSGFGQPIQ